MPYKPNYLCDLHCHTNRSDGNDNPRELIERAGRLGMKIIAITDHDIVPPHSIIKDGLETDAAGYAGKLGIKLVKGMEISCDTEVEDVHILSYGCAWESAFFNSLATITAHSKMESYRELTRILSKNGMEVCWEEVLEYGGSVMEPEKVQKKHIFELLAKKGYVKSWKEAKILIQKTPAFHIKREKPYPTDVIGEIHKAGGIAVLAHPYLIDERLDRAAGPLTRDKYIQMLIDAGLDGIEACYTYDKTSYKGRMTKEAIFREVVSRYRKQLAILSGGSDYHGDDRKGVANARQIGECGIHPGYFENNGLLGGLRI